MKTVLQMDRLTHEEKLRAMEEIWVDLSGAEEELKSPSWHGAVLRDRENAVQEGKDAFIPWEDAKKILLQGAP